MAQKQPYQIHIIDNTAHVISTSTGFADSIKFQNLLKQQKARLLRKGYLLSEYKINWSDSLFSANFYKGPVYKWGEINSSQVPESLLSKSGYKQNRFLNNKVKASSIGLALSNIIHESETNGYPFASVKLDSVHISGDTISANIVYQPGPAITYGKLALSDSLFIKRRYLESYLGINEGATFNSNQIDNIPRLLKQLDFCQMEKQPEIKFELKQCKVNLNLKSVKANTIDALIGLAPNQSNTKKMLATGYVNLDLHNLFHSGKQLYFSWRSYAQESQNLNAIYNHTNLFGSVLNVKIAFGLMKQDTSFLNKNFYLHLGYKRPAYELNLTSQILSSRLLSPVISNGSEPTPEIDFDAQYYGVEVLKNELDNKLNPTKGFTLKLMTNIGSKKVLDTDFVDSTAYDNLDRRMLQGSATITAEWVMPLSSLFVGYTKWEAATIKSSGTLFNNDLFRLGGVNSLRGFNELEIYASSYWKTTWEARLLLGPNSRLFGFLDVAGVQNDVSLPYNLYVGIGTGLLLNTQVGDLQLVLAVGKSEQQSLSLTDSKIHIGYAAKF